MVTADPASPKPSRPELTCPCPTCNHRVPALVEHGGGKICPKCQTEATEHEQRPKGLGRPQTSLRPALFEGEFAEHQTGLSDYVRRKLAIFQRDGFRCAYCGKDLLATVDDLATATVDHVVPKRLGGTKALGNLVTSCYVCNQLKAGTMATSIGEARRIVTQRRAETAASYAQLLSRRGFHLGNRDATKAYGTVHLASVAEMLAGHAESIAQALRIVETVSKRHADTGPQPVEPDPSALEVDGLEGTAFVVVIEGEGEEPYMTHAIPPAAARHYLATFRRYNQENGRTARAVPVGSGHRD